jgi:sugar phosphate isomerase/epimerase
MCIFTSLAKMDSISEQKDFIQEIGICTKFTNAEMLAQHSCDFIEESVGGFLAPDKSEEEFNEILKQAQKSALQVKVCNGFIPGNLKSVGANAVQSEILGYIEIAFQRAEKAGVELIVFGSGGSRSIPEGFSRDEARKQFVSLCKAMAPIAERHNVVVVLEPLNKKECNFINSVTEGGEIVEDVNHPNFRLLADIYHMKMDNEGPESIVKFGYLIKHAHIAEKEGRSAPGTYKEDFMPYFEALKKVSYRGKLSIECNWENMESQSANAILTIKKQL